MAERPVFTRETSRYPRQAHPLGSSEGDADRASIAVPREEPEAARPVTVLTGQELEASYLARLDLGPGYPQIPAEEYIQRIYADEVIQRLSLASPPFWTAHDQLELSRRLRQSLRAFLGIPQNAPYSIEATFSGAVALDRALAAAIHRSVRFGANHTHVITGTPSIDIMRFLLEERGSALTSHFFENRTPDLGCLGVDQVLSLIATIRRRHPHDGLVVLLTSPENPTGNAWTAEDLRAVGLACDRSGGVLIVDHAYLTAGVHDYASIARVWDVVPTDTDWIGIWDTGKTFGLNEDKLGFIISGSKRIADSITFTLANLQFGVSRRQKLVMAQVLNDAIQQHHVTGLRDVCRVNLATAIRLSTNGHLHVRQPMAGSLALVGLGDTTRTDDKVRQDLLRRGIGVVSGRVFFHTSWRPTCFLRVALARQPHYFEAAFEQLVQLTS